jgi:hypothetical protein
MKRAKEFDNILDDCLERLLDKSQTLEQCLAHYPVQAVALKPLLETALLVKKASAIYPDPEFKSRARYQFHAALREMPAKRLFLWPRWATAVTAVVILLLAGGGTVAAASNSMPDGLLYPVKLATEQVRLALTPSDIGKAELYAKLADNRVAEIASVVSSGQPEQLEKVTKQLDSDLVMIATLAEAQTSKAVTEEAARAPMLAAPSPAPAGAGQDNGGNLPANDRWAKLERTLAQHAIDYPEALRAMLDTVPESAKPALLEAITVTEVGYQKAQEAVAGGGGD